MRLWQKKQKQIYHRSDAVFLLQPIKYCTVLICPFTENVHFGQVINVVSVRYLHCKDTLPC